MPLTWNEIKTRAAAFVHEWREETREQAEAKTFWDDFFHVFGVHRRRVATFEEAVKKAGGEQGFIDLFWPGVLLAEHKSRGKDLDTAYEQALDYFPNLPDDQLPRYVVVSDFERMRLHDLEAREESEFAVADLLDHVHRFGFVAGYEKRSYAEQDPVNVEAAEQMGALHDALREAGYEGHRLEVVLVRLLFCLFADDTGIFSPRGAFQDLIETRSREDGADLGPLLMQLFDVLDTPPGDRQETLDDQLEAFPFVNGELFAETLRAPAFNSALRERLLTACRLDWGAISPAIFGSLFQSAMDPEARRELGAHYTSEENIRKLIGPLFLDGLRDELERARRSRPALAAFHDRLAAFRLLDPACGCGNFLVVAYRELRRLEIETVTALYADDLAKGQRVLNIADLMRVSVSQCFGIEVEEFPAQIAQVALWLVDHQMNLEVAEVFGEYFTRLPLTSTPHVLHANALTAEWDAVWGEAQPERFDVILGNPPFVGKQYQTKEQKADLKAVTQGISGSGVLDFVAGWFVKAAQYMQDRPETRTAFVATNSISQGEQVGVLWNELIGEYGCRLHFAHRTFRWDNEAAGRAAVHVVIEGFGVTDRSPKRLFDYEDIRGEPTEKVVSTINPYLVEAANVVVLKRRSPICDVPPIVFGSMPNDGGNLLLSAEERDALLEAEPSAKPFIRRFVGSREFLNGEDRYCLWLDGVSPQALRAMPAVMERVESVRKKRLSSKRKATRDLAATPALFGEVRQPETEYLIIPGVSSENRDYVPLGIISSEVIASNLAYVMPRATPFFLGVLSSVMHMTWMRYTAGRLESRYRYSASLVYNNFPWPEAPSSDQRAAVAEAAKAVLAARAPHLDAGATLADLYDPLAMPPELVAAHQTLDRAVDRAYRPQPFTTEANRVAFLFDRYEALTNALFAG